MVTVGHPGNVGDQRDGYAVSYPGAVSYSYQIGAYDVTGSQYTTFLNAVGATDTYGLYNANMGTDPYGSGVAQISRSGSSGSYTYAVMNNTGNRPITYVSWFDSARFSNWMSNGQPRGAQTSTTTENGAYNVNGATSGNAVAANSTNPNTGSPASRSAPTYRIPLETEWYKAAYYSPNYGGTGVGGYYLYATQSDVAPGTTIGSSANQANYEGAIGHSTDVGSFSGSGSFYGTFDQSGNVYQWNDLDGIAGDSYGSTRGIRGGYFYSNSSNVSLSGRYTQDPSTETGGWSVGFRLASPVVTTTLTPTFGTPIQTVDGFKVQISNYDSSYTWAGTVTALGTVVVSSTGLVTVTGLANGTNSTATITTTKLNTVGGSATVTATSLLAALTPTFGATTSTADGFTVQISNYDSSYTWAGTKFNFFDVGTVVVSSTGLVTVTGLPVGFSAGRSTPTGEFSLKVAITTAKSNTAGGTATFTGTSTLFLHMVTVGNAGNVADANTSSASLFGAVSYSYQIGKYDVTGSQYTKFLNAVGATDTYNLYNANMGRDPYGSGVAQISRSGSSGSYTYAVMDNTGNRPITYVSWFDCGRFSNWMSNGQPSGAQTSTTTENGAYNLNGATSGNPVAANTTNPNTGSAPTHRIPLENEWYKAAYYSPNYSDIGVGGYYRYATQSDSAPGVTNGDYASNRANYNNAIGTVTDVGAFEYSVSFYGTVDQSGNVFQWNDLDGTAGSIPIRGYRGGSWKSGKFAGSDSFWVSAFGRGQSNDLSMEYVDIGFRLASPV